MKHIITIIAALIFSAAAIAKEPEASFFIGAGGSSYESNDQAESTKSVTAGIQFLPGSQLEVEYTQIDNDMVDSFEQTTLRLVAGVYSIGPNSLTMQFGQSYGSVEAGGSSYTDSYGTYGIGYQLRLGDHVTLRYMHNRYLVSEFADTGYDLDRPSENAVSVIVIF